MIRSVYAIILRDFYKRENLLKTILMISIFAGIIYSVGLGIGFIVSKDKISDYVPFFSFGMLIFMILYTGVVVGSEMILDRNGYMKILLVSPISKYDLLIGKTLSIFISSFKTYLIMGIIFLLLNKNLGLLSIVILLLIILLAMLTGISLGIVLCFSSDKTFSDIIIAISSFFLLFMSGVVFPVDAFPPKISTILQLNPIVSLINLFRSIMLGQQIAAYDIFVSAIFCALTVFCAIYLFDRKIRT